MLAKWKSTFKVRLYWIRAALHEPGAVGILVLQQEFDPPAIDWVRNGNSRLMQSVQRHPRRIRIRRQTVKLRPSAVRLLPPAQRRP